MIVTIKEIGQISYSVCLNPGITVAEYLSLVDLSGVEYVDAQGMLVPGDTLRTLFEVDE